MTSSLVLFSGGQDSATCLAWALDRYQRVETIGFDYGQRHRIELDCRNDILAGLRAHSPDWAARLGEDRIVDLGVVGKISQTALTQAIDIQMRADGLPNTFVPGRNLMFFVTAAMVAYRRGLKHLVGGMCETDYSGYPDCRDDTLKALQAAINLGMESRLVIDTPLMWLDKKATWQLAEKLGGRKLVELLRSKSHSCYLGDRATLHDWGHGCGTCPACDLRAKGWREFIGG